jgi:small-conductance mechanosensitive channel
LNLRDIFQSQINTRKKIQQWLDRRFGPSDVKKLQKLLLDLALRRSRSTEAHKQSGLQLAQFNRLIEEGQNALHQARQALLASSLDAGGAGAATSRPAASRPTVPSLLLAPHAPRDPLAERQRRAFLASLEAQHKRVQFDVARLRVRLHQIRQEDERYNQEFYLYRTELYAFLSQKAERHLRHIAARAEGGLWFRKKLRFHRAVFAEILSYHAWLQKQTPVVWLAFRKEFARSYGEMRVDLGIGLEILLVLGFLLLAFATFWLRLQIRHALKPLSVRIEKATNTRRLWQTIWLALKIFYDHLPLLVAYAGLWLLIGMLDAPERWEMTLIGLAFLWVWFRTTLTLINLLFHKDATERLVTELDEATNRGFRRTLKAVSFLLFGLWATTNLLHALKYPSDALAFIDIVFAAFVVLCIQLILWNKDAILSILPRDTRFGRAFLLWTYRLYRYLSVLALVLFGVYAWGYRALAVFVAQGLLYSVLVLVLIYGVYDLLWQSVLWIFGFSRGEQALIQLERRTARNVIRFLQVFVTGSLSVSALLFLLEVWGISGAWEALTQVIFYPLVRVQDTHITPISLAKFAISVVASVWLANVVKRRFSDVLYPLLNLAPSGQYAANTLVGYTIIIVGALGGLQWMGVGLGGLAVFAGVIGIGVGFGLQNIANNFISGLLIIFGRPIAVKDVIEVGGLMGEVKDISTRSVTIETLDGRLVLIPNSEILTSKVINWTLGPAYVWVNLEVGVAYGSDTRLVQKLLMEVAEAHPKVIKTPAPSVRFQHFGSSSLDFSLWVAVADPLTRKAILSDLRYAVDDVFRQHGIVIAFPQQDIHLRPEIETALAEAIKTSENTASARPLSALPDSSLQPTREIRTFASQEKHPPSESETSEPSNKKSL